MKTLFISDLDGTLLNSNAEISDFTLNIINSLIQDNIYFTFATARSVYSAVQITENLNINVPPILMNGVSIYNISEKKYIQNHFISENASDKIIRIFEKYNTQCFMYKIDNNKLVAYYTVLTSEVMQQFARERKNKFKKPFIQLEKFTPDNNIAYFNTTGEYENLLPIKNEIANISDLNYAFYEDTYTKKWYLEIFSKNASKSNGIQFLKEKYNFEKVVCFGDNLNDIPMFNKSDVRVAVANAKPELKNISDFITLSNDENGVAIWLKENYRDITK